LAEGIEKFYSTEEYRQYNGIHPQGGILVDRDSERAKLSNNKRQSKNDFEVK